MTVHAERSPDPARTVLEGVPRVCFYQGGDRCPEDVPFPSCLRASLEFLGERFGCKRLSCTSPSGRFNCTYAYLMGTSGAAFCLSWHTNAWDGGNCDLMRIAPDALQPVRRAFSSVGYSFEALFEAEYAHAVGIPETYVADEAVFRARIRQSLDAGRPVLAHGVVGPPECCLVTGCDEGGDVLIGWSFFQEMPEFGAGLDFEPSGCFRKRDWFRDTPGILLIGEKGERPPRDQVCREALEWAVQVARTPRVRDHHSGFAAYAAWADALLHDDDFPADDPAVLHKRHTVHNDAVGVVAEGRWYASQFLKQMAEQARPLAEDLLAAAACYETEHDLMWQVWNLQGGIGWSEEKVRKLAEPEVRRQMVPIILEARRKDEEAAGHLESALAR